MKLKDCVHCYAVMKLATQISSKLKIQQIVRCVTCYSGFIVATTVRRYLLLQFIFSNLKFLV